MMSNRMIGFIIALILIAYAYAQEQTSPIMAKSEKTFIVPTLPTPPIPIEPIMISKEEAKQPETNSIDSKTILRQAPVLAKAMPDTQDERMEEADINIGLSMQTRQKVVSMLNKLLSDEFVLYTKTLKCHWNVQGIVFHDFHQAFKEQYEKLFDFVDLIAERARALGAPALGSLHNFSTYTRLKEIDSKPMSPVQMVKELLADHELIIRTMRADIDEIARLGDQGTSNFLQDLIVKQEKIAWMLRATAE